MNNLSIIGISACLIGNEIGYNAGYRQSRLCLDLLNKCFTFTKFCPEVAAGSDIPWPTMKLTGELTSPRLVFSRDESYVLTSQLVKGFQKKTQR